MPYIPTQEPFTPVITPIEPPKAPEGPPIVTSITPSIPSFRSVSSLTPLVCDERAIARLLDMLIQRSGLSIPEVARRMGVTQNAVRQYIVGRRTKPSLIWFIKLAELCGARVQIEFPGRR